MREIKFRAWDSRLNKYLNRVTDIRLNIGNGEVHGMMSTGNVPEWTLEQFTGLHDKNGKEIYECDILSQGEARFIVKWDDKHAMYKCFFEDLSDNYCNLDDSYIHEFFEVIGNIHEATK